MAIVTKARAILLAAVWTLAVPRQSSHAQQTPGTGSGGSTQQPGSASSSGTQHPAPANRPQQDALDNLVLEQADEERNITYLESHATFEYRRDQFNGGSSGDSIKLHWLQSFGHSHRMAAGIELPLVHFSGEEGESSPTGLHAAGVELTLPSASADVIGEGQTVLRLAWGCSGQLTSHTLLSAELGYNKAVQNQHVTPRVNSIEPELILSQSFGKRFGGYLDWDNHYDFGVDEYVQTLQTGLEIALDHQEKWTFAPYVLFPLNHASRIIETKNAVGFDLSYTF